ncbi:DUF4870 domain-containing protein [Actinocorallia sp. API 0066]|uniref:DUF4870 domain-containing protein n=1 Tax=Actinocorallia sp. API 0066 TaxID=2896846 RepID=UPI001E3A00FC|nr:DUF4870 domain-containing protein [Actinocorallia sp. API 0066]MCD0453551.1 DUF4870 domain-containing protein [Actinocorallia sp. API 0066]
MSGPAWDPNDPYRQQPTQPPFPGAGAGPGPGPGPYGQPTYPGGYQPPGPGPAPGGPYVPGQQPYGGYGAPVSPSDERLWSIASHLGQLVFGFLVPLVVYLVYKDRSTFIRWHSAQALNLAITAIGWSVVIGIVAIVTFGLGALLYFPFALLELVFLVLAAVGASRGEWYAFPKALAYPLVK